MKKCLFLDRDGVIHQDIHYAHKPSQIRFENGIFPLCRAFQKKGYLIIVITNQAGIARGYYNKQDVIQLHQWMAKRFQEQRVRITAFFYCPHHPRITGSCPCRKPRPGMFRDAITKYGIDPAKSLMIGDKVTDLTAAEQSGVRHLILYRPDQPPAPSHHNRYRHCRKLSALHP